MNEIVYELISIGYEQMDCNDEGLTDFGDACRIYCERNPDVNPDNVETVDNEAAFKHEFSGG